MANEKRLIDANALVDTLTGITFSGWGKDVPYLNQWWHMAVKIKDNFIKAINNAPTVEAVEVVHGYNTGKARWFQCSECGYGFNDIFLLDESEEMLEPKYCAYCGAKMDGDGNA